MAIAAMFDAQRITLDGLVEQVAPGTYTGPAELPKIYEIPADRFIFELLEGMQVYEMGALLITRIVAEPAGVVLTITHQHRWPTWEEVAHARYTLVPDYITMALPLPQRIDFIHAAIGGSVRRTVTLWQIRDTAKGQQQ